jgi:hypothetical protein
MACSNTTAETFSGIFRKCVSTCEPFLNGGVCVVNNYSEGGAPCHTPTKNNLTNRHFFRDDEQAASGLSVRNAG